MTTNAMFADLLAAQSEMPTLQKTAINPHFGNKFIPLEELIAKVLPILNKHNLVLIQQPCVHEGAPALRCCLLHTSGDVIEATMLLQETKPDPQQQGSAITYARRYSLMSLLGLTADVDDDAEANRRNGATQQSTTVVPTAPTKPLTAPPSPPRTAPAPAIARAPNCPQHGPSMKFWPEEPRRSDPTQTLSARYKCTTQGCKDAKGYAEMIWAADWESTLSQQAQYASARGGDEEELPFE